VDTSQRAGDTDIPALDPTTLDPTEEAVLPRPRPKGREARGAIGLTADGRLKSGRLAGLSLTSAIITVAWPVLVDSLLSSLVGLTDTAVAAAISAAVTDAIGNASYTLWFVGLFFMALDVGATALISRAIGGDASRWQTRPWVRRSRWPRWWGWCWGSSWVWSRAAGGAHVRG
jgi:hypothetical protein